MRKNITQIAITFIFKNLNYKPGRKNLLISPVVNILFPTQEYKSYTWKKGNMEEGKQTAEETATKVPFF